MAAEPKREALLHCPESRWLAEHWADRFDLVERQDPPDDASAPFLWAAGDHLELRGPGKGRGLWIPMADIRRRAQQGGELIRACGSARSPTVLDAMAGWGMDGMVLAARGSSVTLVERHPLMGALVEDLARRSGLTVVTRIGDGYEAMRSASPMDVVYLDPMFPERGKGALPGRRMQMLAELVSTDTRPLQAWLECARSVATGRVVLKRRLKDPVVLTPDWQIRGRTVRYDVYRGRRACD